MMVLWLVILIAIGYGAYYFTKNKSAFGVTNETPIDILNKRYARGELTKEQFDKMKEELK